MRIPIEIEVEDDDELEAIVIVLSGVGRLLEERTVRRLTPASDRAVATLGRVAEQLKTKPKRTKAELHLLDRLFQLEDDHRRAMAALSAVARQRDELRAQVSGGPRWWRRAADPTWWPPKVGDKLRRRTSEGVALLCHVVAVFDHAGSTYAAIACWAESRWVYEVIDAGHARFQYYPELLTAADAPT